MFEQTVRPRPAFIARGRSIFFLKTRLIDNFLAEMRNGLALSTSMVLYKELCQSFEISSYFVIFIIVNIEILWLNYDFRPIRTEQNRT